MTSITGTISQFAGEEQYKIQRLKIFMLSTSLGDNFVFLEIKMTFLLLKIS
jgi:hypothetical protein